jgi:hypothetical protein
VVSVDALGQDLATKDNLALALKLGIEPSYTKQGFEFASRDSRIDDQLDLQNAEIPHGFLEFSRTATDETGQDAPIRSELGHYCSM